MFKHVTTRKNVGRSRYGSSKIVVIKRPFTALLLAVFIHLKSISEFDMHIGYKLIGNIISGL